MQIWKFGTAAVVVVASLASAAAAQTAMDHTGHSNAGQMNHSDHMAQAGHGGMSGAETGLVEPGQGAFAAISEIVARLMGDPTTDWSRVDIDALRAHLVDMDLLVSKAEVVSEKIDDGLSMRISLSGDGGGAAGRMVPMHGPVLSSETGWNSELTRDGDDLVWVVTGWNAQDTAMIQALGFFGLMSTGDHHRAHHLGLATGQGMH
ncbi:MAG: hypothetical protein ACWA47_03240 [Brevirhabdus sp.]